MSLTSFRISQSKTPFILSSSILILSSPITTSKNSTSFTFHLYFSNFMYRSFSANFFTISFTILSYSFSLSVLIITSSMKLATFPVLMRSYRISFIMVWKVIGEFVNSKNITVSSNNPSCCGNHLSQ